MLVVFFQLYSGSQSARHSHVVDHVAAVVLQKLQPVLMQTEWEKIYAMGNEENLCATLVCVRDRGSLQPDVVMDDF